MSEILGSDKPKALSCSGLAAKQPALASEKDLTITSWLLHRNAFLVPCLLPETHFSLNKDYDKSIYERNQEYHSLVSILWPSDWKTYVRVLYKDEILNLLNYTIIKKDMPAVPETLKHFHTQLFEAKDQFNNPNETAHRTRSSKTALKSSSLDPSIISQLDSSLFIQLYTIYQNTMETLTQTLPYGMLEADSRANWDQLFKIRSLVLSERQIRLASNSFYSNGIQEILSQDFESKVVELKTNLNKITSIWKTIYLHSKTQHPPINQFDGGLNSYRSFSEQITRAHHEQKFKTQIFEQAQKEPSRGTIDSLIVSTLSYNSKDLAQLSNSLKAFYTKYRLVITNADSKDQFESLSFLYQKAISKYLDDASSQKLKSALYQTLSENKNNVSFIFPLLSSQRVNIQEITYQEKIDNLIKQYKEKQAEFTIPIIVAAIEHKRGDLTLDKALNQAYIYLVSILQFWKALINETEYAQFAFVTHGNYISILMGWIDNDSKIYIFNQNAQTWNNQDLAQMFQLMTLILRLQARTKAFIDSRRDRIIQELQKLASQNFDNFKPWAMKEKN